MNHRSIRFRLTAGYAALAATAFLTLQFLTVGEFSRYLRHDLGASQLQRAAEIGQTLLAGGGRMDEASVAGAIEARYAPARNNHFIRVTRQDGAVLYLSAAPRDGSFDPQRVPALHRWPRVEEEREQRLAGSSPLLITARWFPAPEGQRLLVETGCSLAPLETRVAQLRRRLALALGVVGAVMVAGGALLLERALRPVERLAFKAEEITQQNLKERLPVSRANHELDRLSASLNRMLDRLEDAVLNAKRFGAEAAHELRTPLTVLRGELEQVLQDRRLPADLQVPLEKMLEELERLISTVAKLFTLARLDLGEARASWARVDLTELAASTVDHMLLLAAEKSIALRRELAQPVLVEGDRLRLKQVVVNLVDNAIKYTPRGGTVELRVFSAGNRAVLEVADNGIGIEPEALPRVFDRFSKLEPSRFRQGPPRAGLGLSIVRSICQAHGGEVSVESSPGKGARFRVELPLAGGGEPAPGGPSAKTGRQAH